MKQEEHIQTGVNPALIYVSPQGQDGDRRASVLDNGIRMPKLHRAVRLRNKPNSPFSRLRMYWDLAQMCLLSMDLATTQKDSGRQQFC